jgi:hypothetical protein
VTKPGRKCRVCEHPQRQAIDAALRSGERIATLIGLHGIGEGNIRRHKANHLTAAPVIDATKAPVPAAVTTPDNAAGMTRLVLLKTMQLLRNAEHEGSRREVLAALRAATENLETLSKIRATEPPPYDPARDDLLIQLRDRLAQTLKSCPTCRQRVADDLRAIAEADA